MHWKGLESGRGLIWSKVPALVGRSEEKPHKHLMMSVPVRIRTGCLSNANQKPCCTNQFARWWFLTLLRVTYQWDYIVPGKWMVWAVYGRTIFCHTFRWTNDCTLKIQLRMVQRHWMINCENVTENRHSLFDRIKSTIHSFSILIQVI